MVIVSAAAATVSTDSKSLQPNAESLSLYPTSAKHLCNYPSNCNFTILIGIIFVTTHADTLIGARYIVTGLQNNPTKLYVFLLFYG